MICSFSITIKAYRKTMTQETQVETTRQSKPIIMTWNLKSQSQKDQASFCSTSILSCLG